jgi:hypothetical protein
MSKSRYQRRSSIPVHYQPSKAAAWISLIVLTFWCIIFGLIIYAVASSA